MCANHTVMKYLTSPPAVLLPYTHSLHGVHQLQPASVAATCFCARMQDACRPRHTLRLGLRLNLSWQLDLPPAGHPRVHCATCYHTCAPPPCSCLSRTSLSCRLRRLPGWASASCSSTSLWLWCSTCCQGLAADL